MGEDELLAIIEQEESNCQSNYSGALAEQRRQAMQYYYGEPYGNEVEGRSQVVTTETKDAVEGILPSLMAIFTASDEIVRFEPQNPDDESAAGMATDYVNYVFTRVNNGFLALYCFFKDALLQKNGFLKVYWEKYKDAAQETYENLTDDELAMLAQDQSLELIAHTAHPLAGVPVPINVHDVVFRRSKNYGRICIDPVPPEEVLISRNAPNDLKKTRFVEHLTQKTISEVRAMGFDVPDDIPDFSTMQDFSLERVERLKYDDQQAYQRDMGGGDPATRKVWLREAYMFVDFDDDGIAEYRKITRIGKTILDNVEFDSLPIISATAIPMPHKFMGLSLHDLVKDIQLQSSTLLRSIFDNTYNANNGRYAVLDGMANMDDLLNNRPGGIVRMKTMNAVQRLDTPILGQPAYNLLEYLQKVKQNRVGATDFPNAVDPDAINSKATFVNAYREAALERVTLMARILAETGVKDLFWKILELVSKHQDQPQMAKLRGQWVQIDPREWHNKFNMTVTVGLGTGSQQQILQGAMGILQIQDGIAKMGLADRVVTEKNFYEAARRYAKAVFPKDADVFFTDPTTLPPRQPHPDPKMLEVQLKSQKAQMGDAQKRDKMALDYVLEQQKMGHDTALAEKQQAHEHRSDVLAHGMDYIQHRNNAAEAKAERETAAQEKADNARQGLSVNLNMSEMTQALGGVLQAMQEMMGQMHSMQQQVLENQQQVLQNQQQGHAAMSDALGHVGGMMAELAKPVKVLRDSKGNMIGATRH